MTSILLIIVAVVCIWIALRVALAAVRIFALLVGLAALAGVLYFLFMR